MAGGKGLLSLKIPPEVAEVIRHLPPDLKQGVRAALRALVVDPHQGAPLVGELAGMWRYRVRRYRIVYEFDLTVRVCRIIAVGYRSHLYDELAARLRERAVPPRR